MQHRPKSALESCRISDYVRYIEGLEAIEEGEKACVDNRLLLEKAWQIIANEFYDAKGHFSQASWAEQLLGTLKVRTCLQISRLTLAGRHLLIRAQSRSKVQGSQEHASGDICGTLRSVSSPTQTRQELMQETLRRELGAACTAKQQPTRL